MPKAVAQGAVGLQSRKDEIVKQKQRYRRKSKGHGLVVAWPDDAPPPEELATQVWYAGSAEHKARPVHVSYGLDAALRSDASRCHPSIDRQAAEVALREAMRRRCVSQDFEGNYPRYAWGWLGAQPYVARLDNVTSGAYKGWPIGIEELPSDKEGRLAPQGAPDA